MNRLLFRGTKTFWKTKSSLELALVEYSAHGVYEIIAYDPVMSIHAPRLYIDMNTVISLLNNNDSLVVDGVVTTFLFNHIVLTEYLPESKHVKIDVQAFYNMERTFHDSFLIVNRPEGLPVYPSPFTSESSNDDFMYEFGYVRHLHLSLRDKWRLPLILVRVSKSLPLRESDAKIWACFVHNKTNEELVNFVATDLADRVPAESKQILRTAAHAALLPERCPFPTSGSRSCSLSGTATPLTLSGRSTPITRSRRNSSTPSPESAVSASFTDLSHTATAAPAPTLRSPIRPAGLPPRTPNAHSSAHSNSRRVWGMEGESIDSSPNPTNPQQSGTGTAQTPPRRRTRVPSLENMWPVRMTRSALNSTTASLSAHTSPQLSPRILALTTESGGLLSEQEDDSELALGRTFGTVGNTRHCRLTQANCSIKLTSQRIRRNRYSFGDGVSKWASDLLQRCCSNAHIRVTPLPLTSTGVAVETKEENEDAQFAGSIRNTD